jgi:phosphatidylserine decarboxylase
MPGLFHTNERVAFFGRWRHGFFSMTAVGATNVGSIVVNFDEDLTTNAKGREYRERQYFDGIEVSAGEEMGYFNFGSTIVLVFEAPVNFQFSREPMDRVRVGEGIA